MIEFLFWEGCPSHERALAMLTEEIDAAGLSRDQLKTIELFTREDAERKHFIGSPTIRIDGRDIADTGGEPYGLECRLYHHRNGRPSPLPDRDDLKEALQRHASKGQ